MQASITPNDVRESIPLECVDDFIEQFAALLRAMKTERFKRYAACASFRFQFQG